MELFPGEGHELSWNRREFFNCDQVQFFDPRELALLLGKDQPNYIHGMQDQVALVAVYNAQELNETEVFVMKEREVRSPAIPLITW